MYYSEDEDSDIDDSADEADVGYGEQPTFSNQVDTHPHSTGTTYEEDGILYVERCSEMGEMYSACLGKIVDNPKLALDVLASSTDSWTLCSGAPPMKDQINVINEEDSIDQWKTLVHQGILDHCEDYHVNQADLLDAQGPLNPNIRAASKEELERARKYFGQATPEIIRLTFKHTTQYGRMPASSHLQKRFKSPNPVMNLHRRCEADATDQIFCDTPAMNGGETSAHIFVGRDSKITDVYKSKDNSGPEFLGAFLDRVRTQGVPTKLIADNTPMYRGWNVTKYLRDLVVSMWQCETKY